MIAPGDNLKGGVFVPWRVALYVAGDIGCVKNALLLLDSFFVKEIRPITEQPIVVQVHQHKDVDVSSIKEDYVIAFCALPPPSTNTPLRARAQKNKALLSGAGLHKLRVSLRRVHAV